MKNTHIVMLAAAVLALTACGGQNTETAAETDASQASQVTTNTQTSAAPSTTPSPAPQGVQLVATDRFSGEKIATYTFHGQGRVECAGKTMLQLEFRVDAEPDINIAPNYVITEWEGYINGVDTGESPATLEAARCLPSEYHAVSIQPGESEEIVVLLDVDGLDAIGYRHAFFEKPLILTL